MDRLARLFVAIAMWLVAGIAGAEPAMTADLDAKLHFDCRRVYGFAGGVFFGTTTWEQVGAAEYSPTVSPVFGGACGLVNPKQPLILPWVGVESAPWYIQVRPDGLRMRQFASASVGLSWGGKVVRGGVHGTAGYTALGGGLSMLVMLPSANERTGRHGFDLRVNAYNLGAFGIQGMLLYTAYAGSRK